jgi:hypothetical protein
LNYLSYPHKSAEYFYNTEIPIDFQGCRAIVRQDGSDQLTLTTVQDLGAVVAAAIEFEGEWPEVGGIRGGQITLAELIELGEKVRGEWLNQLPTKWQFLQLGSNSWFSWILRLQTGKPFTVDRVANAELDSGVLETSWVPSYEHPNVTVADLEKNLPSPGATAIDLKEAFSRLVISGTLLALKNGAWDVSDEWNQLLPQLKLTGIEEFVRKVWEDKA